MFFLSRNKSTYHYFRPLEVVPICQTMGIFYVKVWLYFLDKLLKVRSGYVRFCLQRHFVLTTVALLSARLAVIKSSPNHIEPSAAFGEKARMLMVWLFMKAGARRLTPDVVRSGDQFEITFLPVSFCGVIVYPACSYKKFTQ